MIFCHEFLIVLLSLDRDEGILVGGNSLGSSYPGCYNILIDEFRICKGKANVFVAVLVLASSHSQAFFAPAYSWWSEC